MVIEPPASPTREIGGCGGPGSGTSKARSVPKLTRFVRTADGRKRFSLKESGISAHDTGPCDWFAAGASRALHPPPPGEVERMPRSMRADNRISCGSMSFPDLTAELKASMPQLRG